MSQANDITSFYMNMVFSATKNVITENDFDYDKFINEMTHEELRSFASASLGCFVSMLYSYATTINRDPIELLNFYAEHIIAK